MLGVLPIAFIVVAVFAFLICIECRSRGSELLFGGITATFGFLAVLYWVIPLERWQLVTLVIGIAGASCGLLAGSIGVVLIAKDHVQPSGRVAKKAGEQPENHPMGEKERTCP